MIDGWLRAHPRVEYWGALVLSMFIIASLLYVGTK
jgi:hypothetical protein